jgi:hypothetical protein
LHWLRATHSPAAGAVVAAVAAAGAVAVEEDIEVAAVGAGVVEVGTEVAAAEEATVAHPIRATAAFGIPRRARVPIPVHRPRPIRDLRLRHIHGHRQARTRDPAFQVDRNDPTAEDPARELHRLRNGRRIAQGAAPATVRDPVIKDRPTADRSFIAGASPGPGATRSAGSKVPAAVEQLALVDPAEELPARFEAPAAAALQASRDPAAEQPAQFEARVVAAPRASADRAAARRARSAGRVAVARRASEDLVELRPALRGDREVAAWRGRAVRTEEDTSQHFPQGRRAMRGAGMTIGIPVTDGGDPIGLATASAMGGHIRRSGFTIRHCRKTPKLW